MTKKLAVITGASSGIGEATAKTFSNAGYPTLLLARRLEKMESFNLTNSICKKVDVRNRDALVSAIKEAEKQYGPTDMIFNNAGVGIVGYFGISWVWRGSGCPDVGYVEICWNSHQ